MHLGLIIDRAGRLNSVRLVMDAAAVIYMTPKARVLLLNMLRNRNAFCKRCTLVALKEELADGICKPGVGCSGDVDDVYLALEEGPEKSQRLAWLQQKLWQTFVRTLPRTPDADPPTLPDGEFGSGGLP